MENALKSVFVAAMSAASKAFLNILINDGSYMSTVSQKLKDTLKST